MSFLKDDEHIILMNPNPYVHNNWGNPIPLSYPSLDDRKKCREAGIQTALERPIWRKIEPMRGHYDFTMIDEILRLNRAADLKTIFHMYTSATPDWMPDRWFCRYRNGDLVHKREAISLWNEAAQEHIKQYCTMLVKRYSASDVMFIHGGYMEGEAILPVSPALYDDEAIANYSEEYSGLPDIDTEETREWLGEAVWDYYIEQAHILYPPHKELWNMQQFLMHEWGPATGNYMQKELMEGCAEVFEDVHQVLLQYTYYDSAHGEKNRYHVSDLKKSIKGLDVIVEAHFCDGLATTAPQAIGEGFRGQILCPTHPQSGKTSITPEMVGQIKAACDLWRTRT